MLIGFIQKTLTLYENRQGDKFSKTKTFIIHVVNFFKQKKKEKDGEREFIRTREQDPKLKQTTKYFTSSQSHYVWRHSFVTLSSLFTHLLKIVNTLYTYEERLKRLISLL